MAKKKVVKKVAPKKAVVKKHHSSAKKTHILFREIPQLHALTVVFYVLILILFIAIYVTRFA